MKEPRWLTREIVIVLHAELVAEHGGAAGLRDDGALQSAIAHSQQKYHYESPELPDLAAAYAYGLAKNHPFVDGNKRVALAALDVFLRLNGWVLKAKETDTTATVLDLAGSALSEGALRAWVADNVEAL